MSRVVKPMQLLPVLVGFILLNGCSSPAVNQGNNGEILTPPISSEENLENYHTVKRGESLYSIARMYGRDHKDLARWNNIPPPFALNIGQRLILDGTPAEDNSSSEDNYEQEISTPTIKEPQLPEGQHKVGAGDTLFSISRKYNVNWKELAKWNNIQEPYAVNAGQILVVEAPADYAVNNDPIITPTVKPVIPAPSSDQNHHIVLKGDTLYKIAKHYKRSTTDLIKWNNLQAPFSVRLGQKLRITPPDGVDNTLPPALPTVSPSVSDSDHHIVQTGDTLYGISKKHKISIDNLKSWNNLQPPFNLLIGQKLRIKPPATSSSSGSVRPVGLNVTPRYHIVKSREKLEHIANKYGLSASEVAKWNGIAPPYNIYPGLRIKLIPN